MYYYENELKEKLINVKNNNYLLEKEEEYFNIGLEMMKNIGSLDPMLRDELIYETLACWISNKKYNMGQLKDLLNISLDREHLFYKVHVKDEDAVYKRTFSVLIAALIIYEHRKEQFLSEKEIYEVKDKIINYMTNEKDVRGYVEVKGWAHSAAHTADALGELVQCSCFDKSNLMEILNSIKAKVCIEYYVYIYEESERMVTAVLNALSRELLSNSEIINWLKGFCIGNPKGNYIENFHLKVNIKGFLRSLYFRLEDKKNLEGVIKEIKKILMELK